MRKITILNLDELYQVLKEKAQSLWLHGWEIEPKEGLFPEGSLLGFFIKNLRSIKEGTDDLLVAKPEGKSNYMMYPEKLYISSSNTKVGFLIKITIVRWEKNIYGNYENYKSSEVFILDTKEEE